MGFEIAIIGVGLAREQAFELALRRLGMELFERCLGFFDDAIVALRLGQLDEFDRVFIAVLDALVAVDQVVKPVTRADQLLRRLRIVPELWILRLAVQFGESAGRDIPVKDASATRRAISRYPR